MRFSLEVRAGRPEMEEFSGRLVDAIEEAGAKMVPDGDLEADMVLAVGGDGTMLAAVHKSLVWDVPVLGFNLGTLGFLTTAEPSDLDEVVRRLVSGDYRVQERTTVLASIGESAAAGVNDVVVEKIDSTRLVSLDVEVDGEHFFTYRADGLIIATPTGSTAYSFSAGGPLVDPEVGGLVLTPVASHSLFDRAMVLPDSSVIDITVSRDRAVRVNVDKSDLGELGESETVRIRRGDTKARFVVLDSRSFPGVVRDKFGLA